MSRSGSNAASSPQPETTAPSGAEERNRHHKSYESDESKDFCPTIEFTFILLTNLNFFSSLHTEQATSRPGPKRKIQTTEYTEHTELEKSKSCCPHPLAQTPQIFQLILYPRPSASICVHLRPSASICVHLRFDFLPNVHSLDSLDSWCLQILFFLPLSTISSNDPTRHPDPLHRQ